MHETPATNDPAKELRQAKALARVMSRQAHRADAECHEAEARRLEAEARVRYAYRDAARAHAAKVNHEDAIDELRGVFKRWFLDAHAGLTLPQAMQGMAADLQRVLAIADEEDEAVPGV